MSFSKGFFITCIDDQRIFFVDKMNNFLRANFSHSFDTTSLFFNNEQYYHDNECQPKYPVMIGKFYYLRHCHKADSIRQVGDQNKLLIRHVLFVIEKEKRREKKDNTPARKQNLIMYSTPNINACGSEKANYDSNNTSK